MVLMHNGLTLVPFIPLTSDQRCLNISMLRFTGSFFNAIVCFLYERALPAIRTRRTEQSSSARTHRHTPVQSCLIHSVRTDHSIKKLEEYEYPPLTSHRRT